MLSVVVLEESSVSFIPVCVQEGLVLYWLGCFVCLKHIWLCHDWCFSFATCWPQLVSERSMYPWHMHTMCSDSWVREASLKASVIPTSFAPLCNQFLIIQNLNWEWQTVQAMSPSYSKRKVMFTDCGPWTTFWPQLLHTHICVYIQFHWKLPHKRRNQQAKCELVFQFIETYKCCMNPFCLTAII